MMEHSPLQAVHSSLFAECQIWIKRDDLLHPLISGNKYRKLKYTLPSCQPSLVVSMGGPWSNHLHALAFACYQKGWPSYGLVRGLRPDTLELTPTLRDCQAWGMQLQFVSRHEYRLLREQPQYWRGMLKTESDHALWIAEGGRGADALRGLQELPREVQQELGCDPDYLVCACGTGTSLAGFILGAHQAQMHNTKLLGISAVQNGEHLRVQIDDLLPKPMTATSWGYTLMTEFDHGGFAKKSRELLAFCAEFTAQTQIAIEPVYTGKMLYALSQLCRAGFFSTTDRIVAIHTGGLQGARGFS